MKKIFIFILFFYAGLNYSLAEEDVLLNLSDQPAFIADIVETDLNEQPKTLKEKLSDIYYLEVERIDKPTFLFEDILTKEYSDNSIIKKTQFWGAYNANAGFNFLDGEKFNSNYSFDYINIGVDGYLKNNIADFRVMLNYNPTSNRDFAQNLFADVYLATNKIPKHRFLVGNTRPPVGMEGGYSPFLLPFISRAQISRNFGVVRKLGTRISGNYALVDYDLGVYSSDTYFKEFFPGTEFVGWVNFKPLGKTDGRYGKLKVGGGLQSGDRNCDYTVTGAYIGYEYKKWLINFEWADANGYNGPIGYAVDKHAGGFYSTLAYRITPKLQALIRYDQFDPDKNLGNNKIKEYVAGINYFIKGQALKIMLNYVLCQNDCAKDSHRIMLGTQMLF